MYFKKNRSHWSGKPHFQKRSRGGFRQRRANTIEPSFFVKERAHVNEEKIVIENSFSDFAIHEKLKANVISQGFSEPTPIQDQAIPEALKGHDVVGIANTGTGKTIAFLVPLIDKIIKSQFREKALIIAPTRELADQIQKELVLLLKGINIYSALCIGGVGIGGQIKALSRRPNFVIGTPGRLKDLEEQRRLNFYDFGNVVLDEVDRMLDMGFIPDIKYILGKLPQKRQSLFFSATMPDSIRNIVNSFLVKPVTVSVKTANTSANVKQDVVRINGGSKVDILHNLLQKDGFDRVLIFGRTKRGVDTLAKLLSQKKIKLATIHGNKSQRQRLAAIELFKKNHIQVLLATDVASRGLHIDNVTHVINYDQPETKEDYIHRIGRTGRANRTGVALTFVD